ncbi:endonuclease domain-containing protein [Priestia megaterium]|uniref:endonuclease domain-containing protein n=1 Tax=Priestia megaterium TaxID=1404 RepID=UPI003F823D7F
MKCSPYRIALIIARFAIECDGKAYHSSPKQKAYDRRKDAYLRKQGYKVIRIHSSCIVNRISQVLQRLNT